MIVLNPSHGASISNWKGSDLRFYSLGVGEQFEIEDKIAEELKSTYQFLLCINPKTIDEEIERADKELDDINKKDLSELNVEVIKEVRKRRIIKEELGLKKKVLSGEKSKELKGKTDDEVDIKTLTKGELIRMCIDKNISRNVIRNKRKKQLIQLLNS